jgi:hypothetical protein
MPAQWTKEKLVDYVLLMDRGIAFAYDWLDVEQRVPVPVHLNPDGHSELGNVNAFLTEPATYGSQITGYNTFEKGPIGIVAGAVLYIRITSHHITLPTPTYMISGLASVIDGLFEDDIYHSFAINELLERIDNGVLNPVTQQLLLHPDIDVFTDDGFNPDAYMRIHTVAQIGLMEHTGYYPAQPGGGFSSSPVRMRVGMYDEYFGTKLTARSFIRFLIELGGREAFLRYYTGRRLYEETISLAEEIYGMDFRALVDMWLSEYLNYNELAPIVSEIIKGICHGDQSTCTCLTWYEDF